MHQATLGLQTALEDLGEMMLDASMEMEATTLLLEVLVETEATGLMEMEPVDLMETKEMVLVGQEATGLVEIKAMALVEIEATTLVEIKAATSMETEETTLVEMVQVAETQVETSVATLLEVLAETDREALGMEQNDQDREVLGAIKLGLAEEGSSLVMAWGQALALATAIKALRQWPSIRPQ